jgi:hypothetical protein
MADSQTILHERQGDPRGSNASGQSGFWKGQDGINRYVKHYQDDAQVYGEVLANWIYRTLELGAPNSHAFHHQDQPLFASDIMENEGNLGAYDVTPELAHKVAQGFAADVLLANWDAVGMGLDNVVVHKDGSVSRIDQGGSLLMRAQAGRKPNHLLHQITEWEGFFDRGMNWDYSSVMQKAGYRKAEDMGEALVEQITAIENLRNQGGWDAIVSKVVPLWKGRDRDEVVKMLESRTKLLSEKKASILQQLKRSSRLAMVFVQS